MKTSSAKRCTDESALRRDRLISKITKICSCCKQEKNKSDFNKHSNKYDGLNTYCKSCSSKLQSKLRKPERTKEQNKKRKEKNVVRYRCTTFKNNTKKRHESLPPTLDELEHLVRQQLPKGCFYTGVPITESDYGIDHKLPITRGGTNHISNLCVVSQSVNKTKGNMTEHEFMQLLSLVSKWEDKGSSILTRLRLAGTIYKR